LSAYERKAWCTKRGGAESRGVKTVVKSGDLTGMEIQLKKIEGGAASPKTPTVCNEWVQKGAQRFTFLLEERGGRGEKCQGRGDRTWGQMGELVISNGLVFVGDNSARRTKGR